MIDQRAISKGQEQDMKKNFLETDTFNPANVRLKQGYLFAWISTVALLTFQFGQIQMGFNPLIESFKSMFGWTDDNASSYTALISMCSSSGGLAGILVAKKLIEKGRYKAIHIANIIVIIGSSLTMVENITVIIIGRFIVGFAGCGFSSVIVPKFIYETSPIHLRGPLGGVTQVTIFIGCIYAFSLGFFCPTTYEEQTTSSYWRFMFIQPAIVAVIQSLLLFTVFKTDTPQFLLIAQNNEQAARNALRQIYYEQDIDKMVTFIRNSNQSASSKNQTFSEAVCGQDARAATWIGFWLQFFNQMSGLGVVVLYSSIIFTAVGIDAKIGTFLIGVANLIGSIIPIFLINRFGRKTLLYLSFKLMCIFSALTVFAIHNDADTIMVIMIIFFVFAYQLGAGPLPYIYITDICGDAGMSFGTLSLWVWIIVVTIIGPYLVMSKAIGVIGTFIGMIITNFLGFLYCLFILKETKGLNDDQCKNLFKSKGQ